MNPPRTPKSNPAEEPRKLDLHQILGHIHDGYFVEACHAKHAELTEHIVKRGGEGSLTITLKYKGADGGVNITADSALKLPRSIPRAQFVYADTQGQTYLDNPRQTELEFAPFVVREAASPARDSASGTAG